MLTDSTIDAAVRAALDEDAPWGDLTGEVFIPAEASARAVLRPREPGVLSGLTVFARTFALADPTIRVEVRAVDGDSFAPGEVLAEVTGPARSVLRAERIALNFCQRMSGIATLTRAFVEAAGPGVRIVDTRKTVPGLRAFDKHAVVSGGGHNHRFGLSDAVMVKDNHLAVLTGAHRITAETEPAGSHAAQAVTSAIRTARARLPHTTRIEVEVDRLEQIPPVLDGGADVIMLDNFSLADMRRGVELIAGRAIVEASGTVTLESVAEIAATGVDVISSGALTHSVRAVDLGLDVDLGLGLATSTGTETASTAEVEAEAEAGTGASTEAEAEIIALPGARS